MTLKADIDNMELRSDSKGHREKFMANVIPGEVILVSNCGTATAGEVDYRHFWLGECQEGEGGSVSYKWDQASDAQLGITKGGAVINIRWMERALHDHLKFTPGLYQTIDQQCILPMKVVWEKEEMANASKVYYITGELSRNAIELCKKAVPTAEETGSKQNKAKYKDPTIAQLKQVIEQQVATGFLDAGDVPAPSGNKKKADWQKIADGGYLLFSC
jgi:hypothetical protein